MSGINQRIENQLRAVQADPQARPIIDRVKAEAAKGADSRAVLDAAVIATVDEFKRQGRPIEADAVRERAFLAAAAAVTEAPFSLSDLPQGDDKAKHFFVSGFMSLRIADALDRVLPRGLSERLGAAGSFAVGFLKEVYDGVMTWKTNTGTGFSREDLAADAAGASRPFRLSVPKA